MSGATSGSIIATLVVLAITIAIVVYLMNWLYRRSSKETAFVRTGLGGEKVVMNAGAFVLPMPIARRPRSTWSRQNGTCSEPRSWRPIGDW